MNMHNPAHPGEIFKELLIEPLELTIPDHVSSFQSSEPAFSMSRWVRRLSCSFSSAVSTSCASSDMLWRMDSSRRIARCCARSGYVDRYLCIVVLAYYLISKHSFAVSSITGECRLDSVAYLAFSAERVQP